MIFSICQNKKHRRSRLRQRRIRERRAMVCLLPQPGTSTHHIVGGQSLGECASPSRGIFPRKVLAVALLELPAPAVEDLALSAIRLPRFTVFFRQMSMRRAVMTARAESKERHVFLRFSEHVGCVENH